MRGPIELFKASFTGIKQNLGTYVGISLLLGVASLLTSSLEPFSNSGATSTGGQLAYVAVVMLYMVISVLAAIALMLAFAGKATGVSTAYRQAMSYFWRYIGLSIVLSIIIVLGYIFLIIPGIIFSVWFIFAGFALVLEGAGIKDAMMRSKDYTKGKWWGVFGRSVAMILFSMIILPVVAAFAIVLPDNSMLTDLLSVAGSLIVTVVGIGYFYNLYIDVKGGGSMMNETPAPTTPNYSEAGV